MPIIYNIQALRGIAALLLVFHHLSFIEAKYATQQIIPWSLANKGIFGVDLFFVISGFIMVAITRKQFQNGINTKSNAKNFLLRRVIRIYPIYWFFTIITFVVYLWQPHWVNSSQNGQIDWLNTWLLLPSNLLPLLSVGWTLIHEMYFYLVFTLLLAFLSGRFLPYALLTWGSVIICLNINETMASTFANDAYMRLLLNPMTLEFIAGALLARLYFSNKCFSEKTHYKMAITALLCTLLFWLFNDIFRYSLDLTNPKIQQNAGDWRRVLTYIFPAITVMSLVLLLEKLGCIAGKWLLAIGDSSYSLYLSHILVLSACGKLWQFFSTGANWENYVAIPFMVIITIAVGLLSFHLIEKPLISFAKRLTCK